MNGIEKLKVREIKGLINITKIIQAQENVFQLVLRFLMKLIVSI